MVLQRFMTSMLLQVRTHRSSIYSADKSEKAQSIERSATVPPRTVLLRLVLNSSEFLLVVLFVASIGALYLTGLWQRQSTTSVPAFARDWSLLEANCVLTTGGFDAATCAQTRAIADAMHTIAQTLVHQLPSTPVHVTTCVMGANDGFGAILLVFSPLWSHSVSCVPSSVASSVLGLALLETAMNNSSPVFLLSSYIDATDSASATRVDSVEISVLQGILVPTILHLVNGDFFLTLVGWSGVLHRHPALTFDFVSGLERRRLALFFCCSCGFRRSGMSSGLPVFAIYCGILVLQRLPAPPCCRGRAIRILSPLMMLGTLFSSVIVNCGYQDVAATLQNPLWRRPVASDVAVYLPNIGNRSEPFALGAFATLEVPAAASLLQSTVLACLLGTLALSILFPMLLKRRLLLDMRYFARNEFLATQFMPSYVTGLALYEDDCIKYGAKLFAKPSTIALLGHAMVKEAPVTHKIAVVAKDTPGSARGDQTPNSVISIISVYDLVPSLLPHALLPLRVVAWIDNYQYKPAPPNTTLNKTTSYRPTKGSCVS
ncbi:hypothetical protein SPRG_07577 [Saprolegnia parasitica CBS 223.65]|uniref:Uncharacterized protein n=1 Tax=Saprolegnia parasitica (strain CBS 223.65) TaxID=695850 RepID=A0A067CDS9_SAPPC|nr:hypothetical protein SPRG_07577 [Saprolegnia parasitica CBS 223.65]KDO27330.1 hypothetical protein SPRG_07577 [Saprolegnia parasitica CBS 223.65]|eukprot:XP_012202101.1 hypothetical protein SPRG_07577 [Saprolegnia parasitica CBS 223.65]